MVGSINLDFFKTISAFFKTICLCLFVGNLSKDDILFLFLSSKNKIIYSRILMYSSTVISGSKTKHLLDISYLYDILKLKKSKGVL